MGVLLQQSVENRASRFEGLLEDFDHIKGPSASPATFLETAGYPHFENVASNLLAFFLDPEEEHGLGSLFLDALMESLGLEHLSFRSVEREAGTENGKRLDLLLEFETHVIGIENKIFAPVNNPLGDYRAHLENVADGRQSVLAVLCLREPTATLGPAVSVVTYESLMSRVRQALGRHATDAPAQYLSFALDFVKTMENLRKGNRMNQAVLNLFRRKREDVVELLHAANEVSKELRRTVVRAGELVTERRSQELRQQVRQWFYRQQRELTDDLVHDVHFPSGGVVAIDTWVGLEGWEVVVWQRQSVVDKLPMPELATWLQARGLDFRVPVGTTGGYRDRLIIASFPFEAELEEVATYVAGVVSAIANAEAAPGEASSAVSRIESAS